MINGDCLIKTYTEKVNNEYIRILTKLKELFSDIYFDNLNKNNELADLSQEAMKNATKEIDNAKSGYGTKDSKDTQSITYC